VLHREYLGTVAAGKARLLSEGSLAFSLHIVQLCLEVLVLHILP
jgi:hypothetical protein